MENTAAAKKRNAGALPPENNTHELLTPADKPAEQPVHHVRRPAVHRNGALLLMFFTALCGAAAGAAGIFSGAWSTADSCALFGGGSFLEVFLRRAVFGGAFLLAEYILGYSALGDWAVWAAPLLCGMCTAASFTVPTNGAAWMLPSAGAVLAAVIFGGAASADFSVMLLRVARGGNAFLHERAARDFSVKILRYGAAVAAAGLYEAAVMTCGAVHP